MIASTPRRVQRRMSSSSSTVHTQTSLSASWRSATISGRSRTSAMSRPAVPAPATEPRPAHRQRLLRRHQENQRQVRAQARHPTNSHGGERHHPRPHLPGRRAPSIPYSRSNVATSCSTRPPAREGCFVSTANPISRPAPRASSTSSRSVTRAPLSGSRSASAAVLPGAPVDRPELGQRHRRDDARRTSGALEGAVVQAYRARRPPTAGRRTRGRRPPRRSPGGRRRRCARRRRPTNPGGR